MPFSRYPSGSCPCQVSLPFELRHFPAGSLSPLSRIEFVSYRLVVLLRLLPTPPHDDAVAVEYGPENVCPVGTFTLLFKCAYERTGSRFHAANCSDHGGSSHTLRTTEGPPTLGMSQDGKAIGVGKAHWFEPPLPPNRTCGSPASGSPVSGVHGGTDRSARGLRPW